MFLISLVFIVTFSPLDSIEKPLTGNEKKYFRIKTYVALIVILLISIAALYYSKVNIFYASLMSIVLGCILLVLGKIEYLIENKK